METSKDLNYIIDLDGTLYHGASPIPYAKEFIQYLNKNHRKYLLLTNCPGNGAAGVVKRLEAMGIEVKEDSVLTSGQATATFLSKMKPNMSIYLIGSDALREDFLRAGLRIEDVNPDFVVVGYDREFNYEKMCLATKHILKGSKYVSTNGDNIIPEGDTFVPHTGAISACIETATNVKPIIIGKPEQYILDSALEKLGCKKSECCIIGDRLDTDIATGVRHGISSYLVLTGVTDRKLLEQSQLKPTKVFNNLYEIMLFEGEN
jgi:4-nitrophenyl phosphatase